MGQSTPRTAKLATTIGSQVAIHRRFMRSANIERHGDVEFAAEYIPTPRGLEVLRRVAESATGDSSAGQAWSLTGPYGAGKSSFALFLASLFGRADEARTRAALRVLRKADGSLARLVTAARRSLGADERGFLRALVAAGPEPVSLTIRRALESGLRQYFHGRVPKVITTALDEARCDVTGKALCDLLEALTDYAPVLLIIDEFGKNLEHFVTVPQEADLYVLQQIAEMGIGSNALPVFLLTLQHLAVDDYVREASTQQRREWGKVRGRFQDVPFLEGPEQSIRLIAEAFDDSKATPAFRAARSRWAKTSLQVSQRLGLGVDIAGFERLVERCYPLHPTALLALPDLCALLGQYERTLFTFIASDEPHALGEHLAVSPWRSDAMPSLALDAVYDFFAASVTGLASTSAAGARWLEIDTRIREGGGLEAQDRRLLKIIGLLNLLGRTDALRACLPTVLFAVRSRLSEPSDDAEWLYRLHALESKGFLTYRVFADEFRLWEGSDLDLAGAVRGSRERMTAVPVSVLLNAMSLIPPVVAGRHSQKVGQLRYFDSIFADRDSATITAPEAGDAVDGRLVYFVGAPEEAGLLTTVAGEKPVVVITTKMSGPLVDAAREVAATHEVLASEAIGSDRVARRELHEREAAARRRLMKALGEAYRPGAEGVVWKLGSTVVEHSGRGVSSTLSDICDSIYWASPDVKNEMLGRHELTSQGARARTDLLAAMVMGYDQERLGIDGYGPERAMYEAFLHHTGVHRQRPDGSWAFGSPSAFDPLRRAWNAVEESLNDATERHVGADTLYALLMAPPFGLKEGAIPVLVTAVLVSRREDVAVFQDGTYQPQLGADLLERLTKTPSRFSFRALGVTGTRAQVIQLLADALGAEVIRGRRSRNRLVLSVVAPLVGIARDLPEYSLRTSAISREAAAVRSALLESRDPDTMMFVALPSACGMRPIAVAERGRLADGREFVRRLTVALSELKDAFGRLHRECATVLSEQLSAPRGIPELRGQLRARAHLIDSQVLEPHLRTFLHLASDAGLDDESWLEAMMLGLSGRPPASWGDEDVPRFEGKLAEAAGTLARVEALHFEAREHGGTGFDARRIVVTAADGSEMRGVVWIDHDVSRQLQGVASEAVERATDIVGARGPEALMAMLAASVLETTETESEVRVSARRTGARDR
jgi:hypothetical protein